MLTRRFCLLVSCALVACSGDTSTGQQVNATAAAAATAVPASPPSVVRGRVRGASRGGQVYLLVRDPTARDVASLSGTFLAWAEVALDGRFELPAVGPQAAAQPLEVVVSAPGLALARRAVGLEAELVLEAVPEAVVVLTVLGPEGRPEEDAMAIVLDSVGRPLPLPPVELAADQSGRLRATRLPSGAYELLLGSADGLRHARVFVDVAAGEEVVMSVTLRPDPDARLRFYRAIGGPASKLASLLDGGTR